MFDLSIGAKNSLNIAKLFWKRDGRKIEGLDVIELVESDDVTQNEGVS